MKFKTAPLSKKTWKDLVLLFGEKGACGGCWCMTWRLPSSVYQQTKGASNKTLLYELVCQNEALGVILYNETTPIGWCSISPKERLFQQKKSRIFKHTPFEKTWSIVCLYIMPAYRRKGVATVLIEEAYQYASSNGAIIVEAYPVIPKQLDMPDVFAWTGIWKSYLKAGFTIIHQPSTAKYIMQRTKLDTSKG